MLFFYKESKFFIIVLLSIFYFNFFVLLSLQQPVLKQVSTTQKTQQLKTPADQQAEEVLKELAKPNVPVFSSPGNPKSKIAFYQAILAMPLSSEMCLRVIKNFVTNVVISALRDQQVKYENLSFVAKTFFNNNFLLSKVGTLNIDKVKITDSVIGSTVVEIRKRHNEVAAKVKRQDDFLSLLKQAISIKDKKISEKLLGLQKPLEMLKVQGIIIDYVQKFVDAVSGFTLFVKNKGTDAQKNEFKSFLDLVEKAIPSFAQKINELKSTLLGKQVVSQLAQSAGQTQQPISAVKSAMSKQQSKQVALAVEQRSKLGISTNLSSILNVLKKPYYLKNYSVFVQACFDGLMIVKDGKVDKKKLTEFIDLLIKQIPIAYNNRNNQSIKDLEVLLKTLTMASQIKSFSKVIPSHYSKTVSVAIVVAKISRSTLISEKLELCLSIKKLLDSSVAEHERKMFIDVLTNIFQERKKGDYKRDEIKKFRNFLLSLSKEKKGLKNYLAKIQLYILILKGTLVFYAPSTGKNLAKIRKLILNYKSNLSSIVSQEAQYEKGLLTKSLNILFGHSGNLTLKYIKLLRSFFGLVKKKTGLLAKNQIEHMQQWIQFLDKLILTANNQETYLETLIKRISKKVFSPKALNRNLALTQLGDALLLFTYQTKKQVHNSFITLLNKIFNLKEKLSSKQKAILLAILKKISNKKTMSIKKNGKVKQHNFLNQPQETVLKEWIGTLEKSSR